MDIKEKIEKKIAEVKRQTQQSITTGQTLLKQREAFEKRMQLHNQNHLKLLAKRAALEELLQESL